MLTEDFSHAERRTRAIVEREAELGELERLLTDARQAHGRVALIEGPAGIGKTRLLDEVRERAATLGISSLTARGGELERDFGFGIVRQLLEPVLARAGPALLEELTAGAARLAVPAFEAEPGGPTAQATPPYAILHGLYWLVANLAEHSPLLIAVDDVHWSDAPSLRFLIYLARRLDGMPVAVALGGRTGEAAAEPELLRALVLEARPPILRPRPLSETAVSALVKTGLGDDAGPRLCGACHESTRGNPFLLRELLEELRRDSRAAGEISPAVVRRLTSDRITAALLLRIGRIGRQAPPLARAVAVLGTQASLEHARRLAGLDLTETRSLAASLAGAAVFERGEPLCFVHPIVRTAVYEDIPETEREKMHAGAARLLARAGPEAVALHLLSTEPAGEVSVVETLLEAGRAALARGAPETAVRYLRRALAEPPTEDRRGRALLQLGTAESLVDMAAAAEHLADAVEQMSAPGDRLEAARLLAGVLAMSERAVDAVELLEGEIAALDDGQPGLADRLAAHTVDIGRMQPEARCRARELAQRLRQRVTVDGDDLDPAILATVAAEMAMAGEPAERTAALAERALSALTPAETFSISEWTGEVAIRSLVIAERFEPARQALDDALGDAGARGAALEAAMLYSHRGELLVRLGELATAEADARAGLALAGAHGWAVGVPAMVAVLVDALVERGRLDAAEAVVTGDSLGAAAALLPAGYTFNLLLSARGRLRIAQNRPREAVVDLHECGRRLTELGELSPSSVVWRSSAALAHLALGETDAARGLAREELERARVLEAPRALGVALRALALVEGGETGLSLLEQAVRALEPSPARLEHARALVDLGSALRRSGKPTDARERLAAGMDLAHHCGATALVDRAHDELRLAGARPRRIALTGADALTPAERRVAGMAAEGMTNKEIAQALFVTLRTIEMHLSNAYGKLEIESRRELARALDPGMENESRSRPRG